MDLTLTGNPIKIKELKWPVDEAISYPIEFRGKDFYVTMSPYRAFELKQILPNLNYRSEHKGDLVDLKEPDAFDKQQKDFFWNHCQGFFGLVINDQELSPEKTLEFAKNRIIGIENAVIRTCLGMVRIDPKSTDDWFNLQEDRVDVKLYQYIYIPELKGSFRVDMVHQFTAPNQNHFRQYQKAGGTQVNRKKGEWSRSLNYDVVELLYNELIQTVTGITYQGKDIDPKTKDQKEGWLDSIPFWHKDLALSDIFATAEGKNFG